MKTPFRFLAIPLAFALFVAPLLVWLPEPAEAAYSWDATDPVSYEANGVLEDITPEFGNTVRLSTNSFMTAALGFTDAGTDFSNPQVSKCSIDECGAQTAFTPATGMNVESFRLHNRTSTHVYGCAVYSVENVVRVFQSTNGGSTWQAPATISASNPQQCDVSTWDGSHFAVVWSNGTTDDWVASFSTNSGQTFTSTHLITVAPGNLVQRDGAAILAWSDTQYTIYVNQDDNLFDRCDVDTTVAGASLGCSADYIGGLQVNWERYGGTYYLSLTQRSTGGDFVTFATQSSAGEGLSSTDAYNVADANAGICTSDIAVYSPQRIGITFARCATAVAYVLKFAETFDGGATWETEDIYTSGATDGADSVGFAAGASYAPDGRIFASYLVEVDDNLCSGNDADSEAELCQFVFVSGEEFTSVGAAATSEAFTNIIGFDANPTGGYVVIRTDEGAVEEVLTLDGVNLETVDSSETDCNLGPGSDKVFATNLEYTAFVDCDSGGDPTHLKIRDWTNLDALASSEFEDCDWADTDIFLNGFSDTGGDQTGQMGEIAAFPIDMSRVAAGVCFVAWGYASNANGIIGVNTYGAVENSADDTRGLDEVTYSPTTPEDFCVSMVDDEIAYIGAVDTATTTRTYEVTFSGSFVPEIADPDSYGITGGLGIACEDSYVLVNTATQLYKIQQGQTTPTLLKAITGATRGVSVSQDIEPAGRNIAYVDGSNWFVAYASNGTVRATGALPSGTYRDMLLTWESQNLYIATSTQVVRYAISDVVGVGGAGGGGVDVPSTPAPSGILNPGGTPGANILAANLGIPVFGAKLLMATSVILGVTVTTAATLGALTRYRSMAVMAVGAAAGLIGGFLCAWGLQFLDTTGVFVVTVLIVLGLVVGAFMMFKGG